MSTSTHAATVPNVAYVGNNKRLDACYLDNVEDSVPGWKLGEPINYRWKRGEQNLYPRTFLGPEGECVCVVNTHECASVGETWWVVFGTRIDSVRAFLTAIGRARARIEATGVVKQTL